MRPRPLFWQLFPTYLLVIFLALAAVAMYASHALHDFYLGQTTFNLASRARFVQEIVVEPLTARDFHRVNEVCKTVGAATLSRITVVTPTGEVVGDSEGDAETMENHGNRPEIEEALLGRMGSNIRFSSTLQMQMLYVAVPIDAGGGVIGVARVSIPIAFIDEALRKMNAELAMAGLLIAVLAAGVALFITRRISRPLAEMKTVAGLFAGGNLQQRISAPDTVEFAGLADAMNEMARQLDDRIRAVIQQHNELEAVLASMVEGVVAISADGRVLSINRAAARLLQLDADRTTGRVLREVVRNPELHGFVDNVLATHQPIEGEVVLYEESEQYLQLHGAALYDAQGKAMGAVVVFDDITDLRRLERVRRDFVANVSHEIRTPVTSIKGYLETLLDGAMDDPDALQRFLSIMLRQADRLNGIIEDLLTLARIEQDRDEAIQFEKTALLPVLEAAVNTCRDKADERNMVIELRCSPDTEAQLNAALLEQAVVNLLDNAIKYSEDGDTIEIDARQEDGETIVGVRDHGCGIERDHLARVFERFYRVDKARSRKLGGTGLGLAIVKHIMNAHGGRVEVESAPGKGSHFRLHLPAA